MRAELLIQQHFGFDSEQVRTMEDEEFIDYAAAAWVLEESFQDSIACGLAKAIGAIFRGS